MQQPGINLIPVMSRTTLRGNAGRNTQCEPMIPGLGCEPTRRGQEPQFPIEAQNASEKGTDVARSPVACKQAARLRASRAMPLLDVLLPSSVSPPSSSLYPPMAMYGQRAPVASQGRGIGLSGLKHQRHNGIRRAC